MQPQSEELPRRFETVEALDEFMSRPSPALIADLAEIDGDIMVVGVAGKMGPTLARMAKRADPTRRVIGTARFSDPKLKNYLEEHGVEASVTRLDGAVETSVQLGVADVIADVVETGSTLRNAGLEVFGDPILQSEAVLVRGSGAAPDPAFDQLLRRLQGVLVARRYVMMDYDVPVTGVDAAVKLTPGIESPTVSPLRDPAWVAVRAMVPRHEAQRIMDDLWEVGARAILVTDIHACRL